MLVLVLLAAIPDRPDGMDHVARRQPIAFGDFGIAGFAAMQRLTFGQQFWSGSVMYSTIDATPAE